MAWETVRMSDAARRTRNPIRAIVQNIDTSGNPAVQPVIPLSIGDPTLYGNFRPPRSAELKLWNNIESGKYNGYEHSTGWKEARDAIAENGSVAGCSLTANDVMIASGASSALEMCIHVLANPGQNILVPCPGFPLYGTIAGNLGVDVKRYNLCPARNWEIDLEHLESLIDGDTAAIVINNPSNPCGAVFSRQHLLDLLAVAQRKHVPIIADEIYENMVFEGVEYVPIAAVATHVPILSVGGLAKRFMVPGWRVGWVRVYDRDGVFKEVRQGLVQLTQLILGANLAVQSIIPELLLRTDAAYHRQNNAVLQEHALLCADRLNRAPGLRCNAPHGAMYLMVEVEVAKFRDIENDMDFTQKLLREQSVFVLPGACFEFPNFFRVVFTSPRDILEQALERIQTFCAAHVRPSDP